MTGCGAGQNNETQLEHAVVQGAHAQVGPIQIQNIAIIPVGQDIQPSADASLAAPDVTSVSPDALGTPSTLPKGAVDGYLVATIINTAETGNDQLSGVTVAGATVTPAPRGATLTVAPNGILQFGDPADSTSGQFLTLTGVSTPLTIGQTLPVTFTLAGAGATGTVRVPVITSYYGIPPASPPAGGSSNSGRTAPPSGSPALPSHTTSASP